MGDISRRRELPDLSTPEARWHEKRMELAMYFLRMKILESRRGLPKNVEELADWIDHMFREEMAQDLYPPQIVVYDGRRLHAAMFLIVISPGRISMEADQSDPFDRGTSMNYFSFVRTPLYPKTFGRYSPHVEFVFTRQSDILKIPDGQKKSIRTHANTVYREGGVVIRDLEANQMPPGLWIPRYEQKS